MRILILNWRCPINPRAGGAELFTHEVAKRLVAGGDQVEWFSAMFPGASTEQDVDGVHIIRAGRQWTVHFHAFRRYHRRLRSQFDVVLDEVNTVPFFTPLWADIPTIMLIHQLARDVWWYESPFPLSAIGYAAEPMYLQFYRKTPVVTVSKSTERDLRGLRFSGPIAVVPEGLESMPANSYTKASIPTYLYVGRLAPSKRVDHVIRAFAQSKDFLWPAQLWIAGDGPRGYIEKLHLLSRRLGVTANVRFWGRVSSADKHRLMAEAYCLVLASVREGWGLVVTEANACGTPAVVYDVPGLRDAVRHQTTGLVVPPSPAKLSQAMAKLGKEGPLRERLAEEANRWSSQFSFETAAQAVHDVICQTIKSSKSSSAKSSASTVSS